MKAYITGIALLTHRLGEQKTASAKEKLSAGQVRPDLTPTNQFLAALARIGAAS